MRNITHKHTFCFKNDLFFLCTFHTVEFGSAGHHTTFMPFKILNDLSKWKFGKRFENETKMIYEVKRSCLPKKKYN